MTDVTARLRLVVDSTGLDKSGRKLKDLKRSARDVENQAQRMRAAFAGLAGVIGAAFSVQQLKRISDQYTGIQNQLRLVTGSAAELRDVQRQVLGVANETGASLETTVKLYANLERFAGQFLNSQEETLALTRAINQAAVVSGASVTEASNAIRQLTQGIAGGVLRAEEFNSVMENLPRLGEAIASGLGVGIGELRRQVNDGLVTSETLIKALQSEFDTLNQEFLASSKTVGQAMQALGNIVTVELGQRLEGVRGIAVSVLQAIGQNIDKIIPLIEGLGAAILIIGTGFALPAIASSLLALVSPLGAIVASVVGITALASQFDKLTDVIQGAAAALAAYAAVQALALTGGALLTVTKTVTQLIALERALGAATVAAAAQGVVIKYLSAGWAAFSAVVAANPIGFLALAIGAAVGIIITFRDEIAKLTFGVKDAGAVIQATFEVISEKTKPARDAVVGFALNSLEAFKALGEVVTDVINGVRERITAIIPPEAFNAIKDFAKFVIDVFVNLAKTISELFVDALLLPVRAIEKLYDTIANIDLLPDNIQAQLRQAAASYGDFADRIDANAGRETVEAIGTAAKAVVDGVKTAAQGAVQIYDDIKVRAQEIADARADAEKTEENIARQTRQTADQVARLTAEYKKLKDQASKASGDILRGAQDRIGEFEDNVRRADIRFAGPDAKQLTVALQKEFEQLVEDIDELSIGLNEEQLRKLYRALEDAGIEWGREIEDASRSGALGLGAAIRQALADGVGATANLIDFGANIGRDIVSGVGGALDVIKDPLASLGDKILGGVESIANGLASIPGPIGAVAGAVASVAGLVKDIINLFKKPSDKTAQTVFNIFSGSVAGSADDNAPENAKLRDEIAEQIRDFNRQIIGLTGATRGSNNPSTRANEAFINLAVRTDRSTGETFFDVGFQSPNGEQSGGGRFSTQAEAIDEAVRLSISTLRGGASDLLDIAQALANTDLGASEIIDSLNTIIELTDLGGEPLSEYQQRIKELNDIFDDAIRKVNGVAEAEAKLNSAREKAIQGVTRDFNRDIQEQIGGFLNGPLDELEKLLKSQEQRFEEASKLGADIAQVERLAALELRDFFEGLSDSALQEVQSFLGLFEEASNSVARNLDLSRQDLQSTRDFFAQSAQQFAQLRTDNIERFIAASPRESIGILQGRATDLLGQVREGNQSAAQALPQVLSQLIDSARQSFGNTKGFTEVFNFVQGILSDAEAASLAVVSDAERQIAALDESNVILSDIRDILSSSQAANAFFQSYSSGGIASADELLSLIQQGAGLTVASNDNAAALNITGLIAQSVVPIVMPIADSINVFTQRLADLPDLARLQIEATDRVNDTLNDRFDDMVDVLERIENLEKRQLAAYEEAA